MALSARSKKVHDQIKKAGSKRGDLKKIAKEIKKDHELAMELWSTGDFFSQMVATLIMDKKLLTQEVIDELEKGMQKHSYDERNHLAEWLMANQLMKDKQTLALINSWENSPSPMQRRTFWYYQARLRWTGQTPPDNTEHLLSGIEKGIAKEKPEVQWAMNFTAGWIGVFEKKYRARCIKIGEKTGLYKDEVAVPGCTPNYLPGFISMEVGKREKA